MWPVLNTLELVVTVAIIGMPRRVVAQRMLLGEVGVGGAGRWSGLATRLYEVVHTWNADASRSRTSVRMRIPAGTTPTKSPPATVPIPDPAAIDKRNPRYARSTTKLLSRLYRVTATIIVGSDTARDRLPAILMSTAYSSTIVGISNSPPATPIRAATAPMTTPAATPTVV